MKKELTKEIAFKELQNMFQGKPFVLFGTGMSCAVDVKFGMNALQEHLFNKLDEDKLSTYEKSEWQSVQKEIENGVDFESAMNSVENEELINKVVELTGIFVASIDKKYTCTSFHEQFNWPALSLFKKLVEKLPASDKTLHVATPNYDMLAETAFGKAKIPYINGFYGGLVRQLDWNTSQRSITYAENVTQRNTIKPITRKRKHIEFYKVHGSLNLFLMDDLLVENNSWIYLETPFNCERLIITPGLSKYKKLHLYREELLAKFDKAVQKHDFFLFLGFGFNDKQLQTRAITDKLKNQGSIGLIITMESNKGIDELINSSKNLWLVCKSENSTMIKNKNFEKPLFIKDSDLWQIDVFTKTILGD